MKKIVLMCALMLAVTAVPAMADYYVVRGDLGSFRIVDTKPVDPGAIYQGPFLSRHQAEHVVMAQVPLKEGFIEDEMIVSSIPFFNDYSVSRGNVRVFADSLQADAGGPFLLPRYRIVAAPIIADFGLSTGVVRTGAGWGTAATAGSGRVLSSDFGWGIAAGAGSIMLEPDVFRGLGPDLGSTYLVVE